MPEDEHTFHLIGGRAGRIMSRDLGHTAIDGPSRDRGFEEIGVEEAF
jgi:hypothetical protein